MDPRTPADFALLLSDSVDLDSLHFFIDEVLGALPYAEAKALGQAIYSAQVPKFAEGFDYLQGPHIVSWDAQRVLYMDPKTGRAKIAPWREVYELRAEGVLPPDFSTYQHVQNATTLRELHQRLLNTRDAWERPDDADAYRGWERSVWPTFCLKGIEPEDFASFPPIWSWNLWGYLVGSTWETLRIVPRIGPLNWETYRAVRVADGCVNRAVEYFERRAGQLERQGALVMDVAVGRTWGTTFLVYHLDTAVYILDADDKIISSQVVSYEDPDKWHRAIDATKTRKQLEVVVMELLGMGFVARDTAEASYWKERDRFMDKSLGGCYNEFLYDMLTCAAYRQDRFTTPG